MRIAIFTDVYLEIPGGIPSSIKAQKSALETLGHQVTIFCPGWTRSLDPTINVVPTHPLFRPNRVPLAKRPQKILHFIEQEYPNFNTHFDLIHVHYEASCSIAGVKLAKKYHLKLFQTMHGREDIAINANLPSPMKYFVAFALNFLHRTSLSNLQAKSFLKLSPSPSPKSTHSLATIQRDNFLIKNSVCQNMWEIMVRQANQADLVISPTQHFAKNLKHYGVRPNIHVISNGIDDQQLQKYTFKPLPFHHKSSLRIIWSSRLSKEKRILPFLEAVSKSKNLHRIKLTIIGEGNQTQEAKNFASKHFSAKQITFLGLIPHEQIFKYMQKQHLSVINSYGFDTQGMTILEAVACGLPVLYADPAMDEVVPQNGGLRAKDDSIAAMTAQIDYIFEHPEIIQQMSQTIASSRHLVLESTQIKRLLQLYQL